MALLIPNLGEVSMLDAIVGKTTEPLVMKLFKNDYTPVETSVAADFTEADFTGYSSKSLTASSWVSTAGAPSNTTYAAQTFTSTAGSQTQNIYGYMICRATSGVVVFAERFTGAPFNIANLNDAITVTPVLTLD